MLYQKRKNSVRIVNIFLLTISIYTIWFIILYSASPEISVKGIAFLAYYAIWYFYFKKSKRVKNTYNEITSNIEGNQLVMGDTTQNALLKVDIHCPSCGSEVFQSVIPNGSLWNWCPHCKKSVKRLLKRT